MKYNLKNGFTLIELLVVITIIGILATGAVTVFTSQIQKARDTTRINDIKALQTSVEQAYQDESQYPDATQAEFISAVSSYIELIPQDPKNGQNCNDSGGTTTCVYAYTTAQDAGIDNGKYELSTAFEAAGSVTSKAAQVVDNGADDSRFEIGIDVATVVTTVAPGVTTQTCQVLAWSLLLSKACN